MKTKKLTGKLSLNKLTIAHLENNEMVKLDGGVSIPTVQCCDPSESCPWVETCQPICADSELISCAAACN
jgi:natural product precursor